MLSGLDDFLDDDDVTVDDILGEDAPTSGPNIGDIDINGVNFSVGSQEQYAHSATFNLLFGNSVNKNRDSALNYAMAELLNEISDGRLELYFKKAAAERQLLISFSHTYIGKYLIQLLDIMAESFGILEMTDNGIVGGSTEKVGSGINKNMRLYVDVCMKLTLFTREKYAKIYKDACEELGIEPDLNLIETGIYSEFSWIRENGFSNPPNEIK